MSWHRLETADASMFETGPGSAPQLYRFPVRLDATPEQVWTSLASDESISAWPMGPGLGIGLRWTSPRPFGIGTTREVRLPFRAMTVRERFFRWDEGKGYSFYVESANRPGIRRFAENYEIEPDGAGARFTWTIAIEPAPRADFILGLTRPVNQLAFGRVAAGAKRYFAKSR